MNDRKKLFLEANIPGSYLSASKELPEFPARRKMAEWLAAESTAADLSTATPVCAEIRDGSELAIDYTYRQACRLVSMKHAVYCWDLTQLSIDIMQPDFYGSHSAWDRRVMVLVNASQAHETPPYPREVTERMDWMLRNWLRDGRSLVVQGEQGISGSLWWSRDLRGLVTRYTTLSLGTPDFRHDK